MFGWFFALIYPVQHITVRKLIKMRPYHCSTMAAWIRWLFLVNASNEPWLGKGIDHSPGGRWLYTPAYDYTRHMTDPHMRTALQVLKQGMCCIFPKVLAESLMKLWLEPARFHGLRRRCL